MKARIEKNGGLFLIPESETEEYALKKWMKEFNAKDKNGGCEVTLGVEPYDELNNASIYDEFRNTLLAGYKKAIETLDGK